jgi:hypothetical protein
MSSSKRDVGTTISQVYATAGVGVAIAAYGSHIHMSPSSAPAWMPTSFTTGSDAMTLAQIVFALLLGITALESCRAPFLIRFGLFSGVAYSAGLNVGTWVHKALQESGACPGPGWSWLPDADFLLRWSGGLRSQSCGMLNPMIMNAFVYTAGIYFCFAAAALLGNRNGRTLMYVSSIIFAGSWVMWGTYALSRFGFASDAVFDAVYVRAGLVLYSLKVWYDTTRLVDEIESSSDVDVLNLALSAMLNFLQIFIRVIQLVASMKKDERKRR